jgi:hypothetical protein
MGAGDGGGDAAGGDAGSGRAEALFGFVVRIVVIRCGGSYVVGRQTGFA